MRADPSDGKTIWAGFWIFPGIGFQQMPFYAVLLAFIRAD
jgi:hypothetical protein